MNKLGQNDTSAIMAVQYFFEILGSALYVCGLTHLPLERIILTGKVLNFVHKALCEGKKEGEFYRILLANFQLETHMNSIFKVTPLSLYIGADSLGLNGALKHFKKHHHLE